MPVQVPALYKIMHSSGVEVDIFMHHLEGGQRWHGSARHRWWNVAFETAPYDLAELTVFGSADANTYLRENYGDWRPPKTAFNCSTGTPNVSFNRKLVSIVPFLTQAQAGSAIARRACHPRVCSGRKIHPALGLNGGRSATFSQKPPVDGI